MRAKNQWNVLAKYLANGIAKQKNGICRRLLRLKWVTNFMAFETSSDRPFNFIIEQHVKGLILTRKQSGHMISHNFIRAVWKKKQNHGLIIIQNSENRRIWLIGNDLKIIQIIATIWF